MEQHILLTTQAWIEAGKERNSLSVPKPTFLMFLFQNVYWVLLSAYSYVLMLEN